MPRAYLGLLLFQLTHEENISSARCQLSGADVLKTVSDGIRPAGSSVAAVVSVQSRTLCRALELGVFKHSQYKISENSVILYQFSKSLR